MTSIIIFKVLMVSLLLAIAYVGFSEAREIEPRDSEDVFIKRVVYALVVGLLITAAGVAVVSPVGDSKSPSEVPHAILTYTDYNGTKHTEPAAKDISVGKDNVLHYVDMMGHTVDVTIKGYSVTDK